MTTVCKYIVTDPCYLLPDNKWKECCEVFDKYPKDETYQRFDEEVTKALQEFSGDDKAMAIGTGYGDWSNLIEGSNIDKIIQPKFVADAGMVCICKLTSNVEKVLSEFIASQTCIAILKLEGNVKFTFNVENPNWTQLFIEDEKDTFHSMYSEFIDEEDEEY